MVGYLPASGSAGPRDRQTRAPGSPRVGNEREESGGMVSGAVEQAAGGPAFLGSEQPAKGIGTFPPPLSSIFSITIWCRRRSAPPASASLRSPCRDRPIPTTGRSCYSAQPAAARRHFCGSSSVRILPTNDSRRPQRHGRLSPIWKLFSVRDHSAPSLL